jgi:hypothetical protein
MKVTFHERSKIDGDMYHVRIRAADTELTGLFAALKAVAKNDWHAVALGSRKISANDLIVDDDGNVDFAYGEIGNGFYYAVERGQGGSVVFDMNAYKGEGDDYLDRTVNVPLHTTFWIEPAAIIRSMIGA